ncbi:hypothetical protein F511_24311 [Dorcoceras hygrometricum]|uniref:Uncharacterized protein n=1 Tax=Dorcoceras hygrometricum TaxID=472368 RepID=A0A2Z7C500_9LAMI|nr:hypothetical protein F511_24311 [Dorcoceras hygrometricum]
MIALDFAGTTHQSASHNVAPNQDIKSICQRLNMYACAWLRPVSRVNRHFTVGGGRLHQSDPRPEARLLRQPALEGLTRSARMDSPRQVGRNKFRRSKAAAEAFEERREAAT